MKCQKVVTIFWLAQRTERGVYSIIIESWAWPPPKLLKILAISKTSLCTHIGYAFTVINSLPIMKYLLYLQFHIFHGNHKKRVSTNPAKRWSPLFWCGITRKKNLLKIKYSEPAVLWATAAQPCSLLWGRGRGSHWHEGERQRWWLPPQPLLLIGQEGCPLCGWPRPSPPISNKGWAHQGPTANQWWGWGEAATKRLQKWYCAPQTTHNLCVALAQFC